ncbi:hypothetical protein V3M69_01450 [Trueperella pyogenes]|uniref:hypothetical protein n=1 Tax=Trueperella pyogenes TaxID=1661 RepID=UPI00345D6210
MIIGAYAAMPSSRPQQEFLAGLGFATGLEIPWRASALDPDPAWPACWLLPEQRRNGDPRCGARSGTG